MRDGHLEVRSEPMQDLSDRQFMIRVDIGMGEVDGDRTRICVVPWESDHAVEVTALADLDGVVPLQERRQLPVGEIMADPAAGWPQ